jgi:hypothetical protein
MGSAHFRPGNARPRQLQSSAFFTSSNWVISTVASGKLPEIVGSPGRVLRKSWSVVVVYIAAGDREMLPQGLNGWLKISAGALQSTSAAEAGNENDVLIAAVNRCATQNPMRSRGHIEALRYPRSTAAGEGARATQWRVIAMGPTARLKPRPFKTTSKSHAVGGLGIPPFTERRVGHRLH